MKTKFISYPVTALCIATALLLGCGGSDDPTPENCDSRVNAFEAAMNAYISDQSKAKCDAFKDAADNLLDCSALTAAQRNQYEDAVAGIVCD